MSDAKVKLMDAVLELIWTGSYASTTIDHICDKAGVKKGSFYYFFDSKSQLAAEALDASWQDRRVELDRIFSVTVPPLERLQKYCEFNYKVQSEIKAQYGRVLGCPQVSLGCEVCTQEDALQKKIQSIMDYKYKYIESAIRDANAAGLTQVTDPAAMARMSMAYIQGLMTQARIQNSLESLRDLSSGLFSLLGVKSKEVVAA
ncbi:MAG TPA: TetR/AcrR family transcriptional regulator [Candidatus Acidoferrales bacterium]|nr:TetR/AcrR family transcriptional regulator [Candidatus Acidoferrales bacterium]